MLTFNPEPEAACARVCEMSGKGYELLAECNVAGVLVQKLRSTRTGIVVCIANVEGPLVNGYFCLGWCVLNRAGTLADVASRESLSFSHRGS